MRRPAAVDHGKQAAGWESEQTRATGRTPQQSMGTTWRPLVLTASEQQASKLALQAGLHFFQSMELGSIIPCAHAAGMRASGICVAAALFWAELSAAVSGGGGPERRGLGWSEEAPPPLRCA